MDQNQPSERETQKRGRLPIVAKEEEDVTDVPGPSAGPSARPSAGSSLLRYRPRAKVARPGTDELIAELIKKYMGKERTALDETLDLLQGLSANLPEAERLGFSNYIAKKAVRYVNKKMKDDSS